LKVATRSVPLELIDLGNELQDFRRDVDISDFVCVDIHLYPFSPDSVPIASDIRLHPFTSEYAIQSAPFGLVPTDP